LFRGRIDLLSKVAFWPFYWSGRRKVRDVQMADGYRRITETGSMADLGRFLTKNRVTLSATITGLQRHTADSKGTGSDGIKVEWDALIAGD